MARKKVIIDASPGLDDARAIILLLTVPDIEVVGITTVSGAGYVDQVTKNAKMTLNAVHRNDIPVFPGTTHNLSGEQISGDKYYGENAFGNLNLPIPEDIPSPKIMAPQAIVNLVNKYPKDVSIVALGPLTNIALAYLQDRFLPSKIIGLYWMGGDRSEKTTYNISESAHSNAFNDPSAAGLVLENFGKSAMSPLYVADWSFCQKYPVEPVLFSSLADEIAIKPKRENESLIFKAKPPIINSESADTAVPKMYITSDLIAMIFFDISLVTKSLSVKLSKIELEGPQKGHTTFTSEKDSNIILIDEIDFARFKTYYYNFLRHAVRKPVSGRKPKSYCDIY